MKPYADRLGRMKGEGALEVLARAVAWPLLELARRLKRSSTLVIVACAVPR